MARKRSNQSRHMENPERILPRIISKYETLIIKCTQLDNTIYTLDPPDSPLGDDNDLLILNNSESTLSFGVNGSRVEPGTGVQFRWAGDWYLIGDPVLEGIIKDLKKYPPASQHVRIDGVAVGSTVYTDEGLAYLKRKVDSAVTTVSVIRKDLSRVKEDTDSNYSMWSASRGEVENLRDKLKKSDESHKSLALVVDKLRDEISHVLGIALASDEIISLRKDVAEVQSFNAGIKCVLSDDVLLDDLDGGDIKVSAADLNAAAVGTYKRTVSVRLNTNIAGVYNTWAQFTPPVPVPSKGDVADVDISAPTVEGTPKLVNGIMDVVLVFDTDAGATKTYVDGEQMSLGSIKVASDDKMVGSVPAGQTVTAHSVTISVVA